MTTLLKTSAILMALASLPMAAGAETTTPDKAAPPMTGSGDMTGMMGGGSMKMDGMEMDGMMGQMIQMMQMMQMMEMMQMSRMMAACEKMMAGMSMMDGGASMEPKPKG